MFLTQSSISGGEANVSRRSRSSRWGIALGIYQIFLQTFPILYIFSFYVPRLPTTEQINPTTTAFRQLLALRSAGDQKTKLLFKAMRYNGIICILAQKMVNFGNCRHKTGFRAAEWAPTGKQKVSRFTSGYGDVMIPVSRVRRSRKNGACIGVA